MKGDDPRLEGAYAVDAVSDDERRRHEAAMDADRELRDETASLAAAAAQLSHLSATAPPERLRGDVLAAIGGVRPLPPVVQDEQASNVRHGEQPTDAPPHDGAVRPIRRRATLVAAIAAAAALFVAVLVVLGQRDVQTPSAADAVMSASDVSSYQKPVDDWTATLYVSPSRDAAVIMSDAMPDAPAGHDFQVWLVMPGDTMVSAGLMPRTSGKGQQFVVTGDVEKATGVAVSVEPAGGSVQPTTYPVLKIEL